MHVCVPALHTPTLSMGSPLELVWVSQGSLVPMRQVQAVSTVLSGLPSQSLSRLEEQLRAAGNVAPAHGV
jgi:hypothetical protein